MKQYGAGSSRGKIPRAPCGQSCTKTVIIHSFIHSFTKCLQRPPRICQPGRRDTTSLRQAWVLSSPPPRPPCGLAEGRAGRGAARVETVMWRRKRAADGVLGPREGFPEMGWTLAWRRGGGGRGRAPRTALQEKVWGRGAEERKRRGGEVRRRAAGWGQGEGRPRAGG